MNKKSKNKRSTKNKRHAKRNSDKLLKKLLAINMLLSKCWNGTIKE